MQNSTSPRWSDMLSLLRMFQQIIRERVAMIPSCRGVGGEKKPGAENGKYYLGDRDDAILLGRTVPDRERDKMIVY